MVVHLLKMAVGIESLVHLSRVQTSRLQKLEQAGEPPVLKHWTRNTPVRAKEICGGGSIYWIVKGAIRARQRVTAIEKGASGKTGKRCAFVLDSVLVRTEFKPMRAMQGWRYLNEDAAPKDLMQRSENGGDLPADMAQELRDLGLL